MWIGTCVPEYFQLIFTCTFSLQAAPPRALSLAPTPTGGEKLDPSQLTGEERRAVNPSTTPTATTRCSRIVLLSNSGRL